MDGQVVFVIYIYIYIKFFGAFKKIEKWLKWFFKHNFPDSLYKSNLFQINPPAPIAVASSVVSVDHPWPLVNFARVGLSAAEASKDDGVFIGWMILDRMINVDYGTVDLLDVFFGRYLVLYTLYDILTTQILPCFCSLSNSLSAWFSPYQYLIPNPENCQLSSNFANLYVGRLVDGTFEWEELGSMAVLQQPGTK